MKNISKWVWIAAVIAVLAVSLMSTENALQKPGVVIPFSQFTKLVEQNTIQEVSIDGNQATAILRARTSLDGNLESVDRVRTVFPKEMEQDLFEIMLGNDVAVWFKPTDDNDAWYRIIVPWILILGVYFFLVRRMQGNLLDRFGGRSLKDFLQGSAVEEAKSTRKVTFKDVAGQENAKREVSELVDFLKNPDAYQKLGADPPRGVLLMGPPGTGKTLMARALAGEAGVNFFHISASEFIEMFVGVGASRVRKMFEEARKRAPSIIFIDELDAVGRVRGTGMGGGNDEREQTLNQILSELDGFSGHETVIVLAATNRPDVLDPALLRPGRFDRHITLELPDKLARTEILAVHTRDVPLANDVDLGTVAANCPGFSGADLKNLVNEASIAAAREGSDEVTMHHFDQMRDRIIMGTVRTLAIQQDEHHRLAVHEAGHTAVAWYLPNTDPVYKVTIIPRGRALGGTHMLPEKERHTLSEDHLRARLAVTLGGRCSEKHFLGNVSSGADDDIQSATQIARAMVTRWGMSDDIGPVDLRQSDEHPFLGREIAQPRHFSETMANKVDESVSELLDSAEKTAHKIIEDHAQQISELISALEKEETLEQSQIGKILNAKHGNSVLVDASQTFIKPD